MNMKFIPVRLIAACALPALALTACSDKDEPPPEPTPETPDTPATEEVENAKFVIATTVQLSGNSATVLLTTESLDEGELTPNGNNGLVVDAATQWVFHDKNYLYALNYNQGEAGATRSYVLNDNGNMKERAERYKISRFSSYGMYNDYILTTSTGDGPAALADGNGYLPKTLLITYLDVKNETSRANDTSTGSYSMENLLNNGEYVTLSGAEQSGNLLYCGAIPMGLSQYGSANTPGSIRPGFEDLVAEADGGQGGGSYKKGELSGTQWPDEGWVAIYDNENMTRPFCIKSNKISTPCGRFRSQYYQTIWAAENGDIYVFSPSYAKTMTDSRQQTKLPAGVVRIPAGKKNFDDYYCNLEEQTGGKSFMRCWPAGGNYFIFVMYDRPLTQKGFAATELAIFDADAKKLTYVTNLPSDITGFGKTVYTHNGYVYIPVNSESGYPAIYRIDPKTAVAQKGVTVEGTDITAMGYMEPAK